MGGRFDDPRRAARAGRYELIQGIEKSGETNEDLEDGWIHGWVADRNVNRRIIYVFHAYIALFIYPLLAALAG